jgi:hypothetical protein
MIEKIYTRDAQIPLIADDLDFSEGWRCIPLPPDQSGEWFIFDTSKDYKTGWMRIKTDNVGSRLLPCQNAT